MKQVLFIKHYPVIDITVLICFRNDTCIYSSIFKSEDIRVTSVAVPKYIKFLCYYARTISSNISSLCEIFLHRTGRLAAKAEQRHK